MITAENDMTYKELLDYLKVLPEEALSTKVIIYDQLNDYFVEVDKIKTNQFSSSLKEPNVVIII